MSGPTAPLERLGRSWRQLSKFAVWLVAAVVLVVNPPPRLWIGADTPAYLRLAEFVAAVLVGVGLFYRPRATRPLVVGALTALVIGCLAFFSYGAIAAGWTCEYDGHGPVLVGSRLSDDAAGYVAANPTLRADCARLIQDYAGRTDLIWDRGELFHRQQMLGLGFILTVLLLSAAAFLVLTALDHRQQEASKT